MKNNFDKRKGRLIVVDGVKWKWKVGRGNGVVMFSENGQKLYAYANIMKNRADVARGQWKKTREGMILPFDIEKWIRLNTKKSK